MYLLASAERAEDIASVFNKFLDPVPNHSAEITGLMSVCFALSSALRELAQATSDPRWQTGQFQIKDDLQTLLRSLDYTFNDVHRLFGGLGRTTSISPSAGYRQVWREVESHFREESNNTLSGRLRLYGIFLDDMICIIYDGYPPDDIDYDDLYDRIAALLDKQEDRLDVDMGNLSIGALGPSGSARQRSHERQRPRRPSGLGPDLPSPRRTRPDLHSPRGSAFEPFVISSPLAPEVPNSPTTTASSSTFSNPSSSNSSAISHWVPKVFEQSRSTTSFKHPGLVSGCYGEEMAPGTSSGLMEDYEKLTQLPFENGDLAVRLYLRSADQRARIHCRNMRHHSARKQYCMALTSLRIERERSTLNLWPVGSSGRTKDLWASLRFLSYEKLVVFFCTFLALKAEDRASRNRQSEDEELRGEELLYSGKIVGHFEDALQLLRDRDSDVIRLQASVYWGELARKPVWTAFITHQISSLRWMRQVDSKTIHLVDLQPHIFDNNYVSQLGPSGEHELRFVTSSDAHDFVAAIRKVRDDI